MGTSKHVAILLTVALTGLLTAGQDGPTASSQAAPRGPSNTRSASGIVRITVDPAILPLNGETIDSLIHSPGVLLKAGRDVLSLNTPDAFNKLIQPQDSERSLITIRWLNTSSAPMSPAARIPRQGRDYGNKGYDEEMMRQLEQIYGPAYVQQMRGSPNEEKKGDVKESGSGAPGMGAGAAGGMGGMGMSSGAVPAQESSTEVRRLPGESDVAYRTRLAQVRSQQKALQEMKSRGMGSMGAGMGGYGGMGMGGMGMGSAGGGMMGGYGGMGGMGFSYGAPGAPQQDAGAAQSATIELQVNLPDTVPALADEFLKSVVKNLQDSLSRAHESYTTDMERALAAAKAQHQNVESEMEGRAGDVATVRKQLDKLVDVSELKAQTPLSVAVDMLRKSVDPPLNIVVLWRDIEVNTNNLPTSPIKVDGSPKMRLATALDLLVRGLEDGMTIGTPMWRIKDDTIVIGTTTTLGRSQEAAWRPRIEADAVNLGGQRSELARRIQSLELDLAGLDARREAVGTQILNIRKQVDERLSQDAAIRELEKLTQIYTGATTTPEGRMISPNSPEAQQNMIRVKIELANRREELSKQAGGGQLEEFNKELSRMAVDTAEKVAQLTIVRKQLDEVQKQLAQALAFDPEAARLRLAQESLDITARRATELQTRLANLQPPTVIMIGAN